MFFGVKSFNFFIWFAITICFYFYFQIYFRNRRKVNAQIDYLFALVQVTFVSLIWCIFYIYLSNKKCFKFSHQLNVTTCTVENFFQKKAMHISRTFSSCLCQFNLTLRNNLLVLRWYFKNLDFSFVNLKSRLNCRSAYTVHMLKRLLAQTKLDVSYFTVVVVILIIILSSWLPSLQVLNLVKITFVTHVKQRVDLKQLLKREVKYTLLTSLNLCALYKCV